MRNFTTLTLLLLAGAAAGCGPGPATDGRGGPLVHVGRQAHAITDGVTDDGHPSVGELQAGVSGQVGNCTATLVGQRTVLTAAHCIQPGRQHLFKLGGVEYTVATLIPHEQWDPSNTTTYPNDIGLVVLSEAPGATPSPIATSPPRVGDPITLVGFGSTADDAKDGGIKRRTTNVIETVDTRRFKYAGTGAGVGNVCIGDSGGPAFAGQGPEVVVGVTSAGGTPCGKLAWDTRVDAYEDWLLQKGGADVTLPPSGDSEQPQVTITSPVDGGTVPLSVDVTAQATDNVGVIAVEIFVGADAASLTSQGTLDQAPFVQRLALSAGQQLIKVVARDAANNQGAASVHVTVDPSAPVLHGGTLAGGCALGAGDPAPSLPLALAPLALLALLRGRSRPK